MDLDIYNTTKNWCFTHLDQEAEEKFSKIEQATRAKAPENFYHKQTILHLDFMKKSELYPLLQSLPKGVLHHLHFDCAEDVQFYEKYVINDPKIYLSSDRKQMRIGTKQKAKEQGWIAMSEQRKKYASDHEFAQKVSSITMLTTPELKEMSFNQTQMWQRFQQKIGNFFILVFTLDIFKKYAKHVLLKYIKNGYDRIQFRAILAKLTEYDNEGNFVKEHDQKMYMDAFDEVYDEVKKQHPHFTAAFVFFGLKVFSPQQNQDLFTKVCQLNWDKTIGLDFVQQEDQFGSLTQYDPIVDKVLAKFPHLDYKKVYHAGETKNHRTHNLDVAVKAGSVRIGHGFNVLQRMEFLPHCRNICFEKNPLSNLVLGYNSDARQASAPILLGLGFAVSINPDDPGKFGVDDNTIDYFLASISYNWTLRDLKLIAYHSINHAICDEHTRSILLRQFNQKWNKWVKQFVGTHHVEPIHKWHEPDIFTNVRGWAWNQQQQKALNKFEQIREGSVNSLPQGFYQQKVLSHLKFIKQQKLYNHLKTIPKGSLHHCHFDCNQDLEFFKRFVINNPRIYLNKEKKQFKIGTKEQAEKNSWISLSNLKKECNNSDQELAQFLYQLTSFNRDESIEVSGKAEKFWPPFQEKIARFNVLLSITDIFSNYSQHVLRKYIGNGYQRVQFRALLTGLKQYSPEGVLIKQHSQHKFAEVFDQVYSKVRKDHPQFTAGFIFCGLRSLSDQQNYNMLKKVFELNWKLTVGIDFVQQEDPYGSLQRQDKVADRLMTEYPDRKIEKCYHAGDTRDHRNHNIEVALRGGSVRIGHGLNITQHIQIVPLCIRTCFEICPIANIIAGGSARSDLRLSTAPILLGLGIPVSINPDDPGKFGYQDSTVDYFCSGVSFNWTLKHFKLIAIHSINHSICSEGVKIRMHKQFSKKWAQWIQQLMKE